MTQFLYMCASPLFVHIDREVEIIKGIEITTENMNNPKDIPIASDPET